MQGRNEGAPWLGNPGSHPLPHWHQNRWAKPGRPPPPFPGAPPSSPLLVPSFCWGLWAPGQWPALSHSCSSHIWTGAAGPAPPPALHGPSLQATCKDVCPLKVPQQLSWELLERARALDSASCGPNADLLLGSHGGSGALSLTPQRPSFPTCDVTPQGRNKLMHVTRLSRVSQALCWEEALETGGQELQT